jgi:hypothetical protein
MSAVLNPERECLAQVLRDRRDFFNARFERAKHSSPNLSAPPLFAFLDECLLPLVLAVNKDAPDRVAAVVEAGFDVALTLVASGLWPNSEKLPILRHAFAVSLPALRRPIGQAPQLLLTKLLNALLSANLDVLLWLARLESMSAALHTPQQVLDAGLIAAWRGGLAHFRAQALQRLAQVPPLALRTLFASQLAVDALISNLQTQRWYRAHAELGADEIAARVGAFVSLGGPFAAPPTLRSEGQQIFVSSADRHWLLDADAYGFTLHAADSAEFASAPKPSAAMPPQRVLKWRCGKRSVALTQWGEISSFVATADTLALTHTRSHAITLIANRA